MFTQSFPAPGVGNPRDVEKEGQDITNNSTLKASSDPADVYVGLLAEHPSSADYAEHVTGTEPFPKLTGSATTSPPSKAKASKTINDMPTLKSSNTTTGIVPTLKTLDKPTPPLPEPDFIAPRPAVKQRYVSAGGNTPLSERAEIPGPAFHPTTPSPRSGQPISEEELAAGLRDPEWIRRHFGEGAVAAMFKGRRFSDENEARDNESDRGTPSGKRDRTSSGASKREKLKRMFSRKNSIAETEY
jgi:hypothetical protein